MNDVSKSFFSALWEQHPEGDVKTLGWGSSESQRQRFDKLLSIIPNKDINGKTVLDVGCGFGDLLTYASPFPRDPEDKFVYIGMDMIERTVEEAKKAHKGDPAAAFVHGSFLEYDFGDSGFDYVFASGIFSVKSTDWEHNAYASLKKMFSLCRIGMATNFLSSVHSDQIITSQYIHPATILTFCLRELTPWINLIHDYRTNDFTIHLHKAKQD